MLNLSSLTPYQPGVGASAVTSPSGELATRWLQPSHPRYEGSIPSSSGSSSSSLPISPSITDVRLSRGTVSPELSTRSRPPSGSIPSSSSQASLQLPRKSRNNRSQIPHFSERVFPASRSASQHTTSSGASVGSLPISQSVAISSLLQPPRSSLSMLASASDPAIPQSARHTSRGAELEHRHSAPSELLSESQDLLSVSDIPHHSHSPVSFASGIPSAGAISAEQLISATTDSLDALATLVEGSFDPSNQQFLLPPSDSPPP